MRNKNENNIEITMTFDLVDIYFILKYFLFAIFSVFAYLFLIFEFLSLICHILCDFYDFFKFSIIFIEFSTIINYLFE